MGQFFYLNPVYLTFNFLFCMFAKNIYNNSTSFMLLKLNDLFIIIMITFKGFISDLPAMFRGTMKHSPDIEEIRDEIFSDKNIPSYLNDKLMLKSDFNLIAKDMHSALKAYKSAKKTNG
jgi:hypothetical protein